MWNSVFCQETRQDLDRLKRLRFVRFTFACLCRQVQSSAVRIHLKSKSHHCVLQQIVGRIAGFRMFSVHVAKMRMVSFGRPSFSLYTASGGAALYNNTVGALQHGYRFGSTS
jgi:hypothetical protein